MNTTQLLPQPVRTAFPLGDVYITDRAQQRLSATRVINALARHSQGDWGDLDTDDVYANELALEFGGGSLQSRYGTNDREFWILTDNQRVSTIVMLPEDYDTPFHANEISTPEFSGGQL